MQSHQRYFPLVDDDGDALQPVPLRDQRRPRLDARRSPPATSGCCEGRIEDAEFSFEKDKATGLEQMAAAARARSSSTTRPARMTDKTERLVALTGYLAEADRRSRRSPGARARSRAAGQGRPGVGHGARVRRPGRRHGRDLRPHGRPSPRGGPGHPRAVPARRGRRRACPRPLPGALLATAEKVDNIVAAFACGEPPSGSKDPYGLRRAAAGMVAIATQHGLRYDVEALVDRAYDELERFPGLVDRRGRWCPRPPPSSWNGWPRRSPTTASPATPWTPCCPPRATSWTCATGPPRVAAFRAPPAWDDLVTVFTRPSNLAKKLPGRGRRPRWTPASSPTRRSRCSSQAWDASGRGCARRQVAAEDYGDGPGHAGRPAPRGRPLLRRRAGHGRGRGGAAEPPAPAGGIAGTVRTVAHLDRLQ